MDAITRTKLAKLGLVLTACTNTNIVGHSRRLTGVKYGLDFYECELEVAAAELYAETLREFTSLMRKAG